MYSDDENSNDEGLPPNKTAESLVSFIDGISHTGDFATIHSFHDFPLPGIHVEGVGSIPMPLTPDAMQALIKESHKAPFGMNDKTVVDDSVRKTWEIEGSKVSFKNPQWNMWLNTVAKQAAEKLGVAGGSENVDAELYKMLIYEPGAMFKPHRDTERFDGMFGSLIICLPSEHEGGAVELRHENRTFKFETGALSAFGITALAWYSDITHEIKPVETGCRWVLTYNLTSKANLSPQPTAELDSQVYQFQKLLEDGWQHLPCTNGFVYALEHQYTHPSLELKHLKGRDFTRAKFISQACTGKGKYHVLLASMEKLVQLGEDGCPPDEEQLTFSKIVNLDGVDLFPADTMTHPKIEKSMVLQSLYYKSRKPDKQWGGEYCGNDHETVERSYKNSVLLVVPVQDFGKFFLNSSMHQYTACVLFIHLVELYRRQKHSFPKLSELITEICQKYLINVPDWQNEKEAVMHGYRLVAAGWMDNTDMFRDTVNLVAQIKCKLPMIVFKALGVTIDLENGLVEPENLLKALGFPTPASLRYFWTRLSQFLAGQKVLCGPDQAKEERMNEWARGILSKFVNELSVIDPLHAFAVLEIAARYRHTALFEQLKTLIAKFQSDAKFINMLVIECLNTLHPTYSNKDPSIQQVIRDVVGDILPSILITTFENFNPTVFISYCKPNPKYTSDGYDSDDSYINSDYNGWLIAEFYRQLTRLLGPDLSEGLFVKLEHGLRTTYKHVLHGITFSLLENILPDLRPDSPNAFRFCCNVLDIYATKFLLLEPEGPGSLVRPGAIDTYTHEDCNECADCKIIYAFLRDPHAESIQLPSRVQEEHYWGLPNGVKWREQDTYSKDEMRELVKGDVDWEWETVQWARRYKKGQRRVARLPQDLLKRILGAEFERLTTFAQIKADPSRKRPARVIEQQQSEDGSSSSPKNIHAEIDKSVILSYEEFGL